MKPILALLLLFALAVPACTDENNRALISGDRAYLLRSPEIVAAGGTHFLSASPDGAAMLFVQFGGVTGAFSGMLRSEDDIFTDSVLMSYAAGRDKPVVLWRTANTATDWRMVDEVDWFAGNEIALVRVTHGHQEKNDDITFATELLTVNVRRQTARVVSTSEPLPRPVSINSSPTRPEAVLRSLDMVNDAAVEKIYIVGASGIVTPVYTSANYTRWDRWNEDGTELTGKEYVPGSKSDNGRYFALNLRTKTMRVIPKPDAPPRPTEPKPPEPLAPVRLRGERGSVASGTIKRPADCVIAENVDVTERVIIAADAVPVTILVDGTHRKLIYQTPAGLFAVPVLNRSYAEYAAYMRTQIEQNAYFVYNALYKWREETGTATFPASGDAVALLVGKDKLPNDAVLRDPRTGAMAFRSLDTGKPDSTGNIPVFALQTVFGKLTFYPNDSSNEAIVVWDTPNPPAKP